MKRRRIGLLSALIMIMVLGSVLAINRIRAVDPLPNPSSVVIPICEAPAHQQENDFPCLQGNAGDNQAYSWGTNCLPTATNPCQFNTAFRAAITIAFSNPNFNPNDPTTDLLLQVVVNNNFVFGTGTALGPAAQAAGQVCLGTADFNTVTNNVCNDTTLGFQPFTIHPGHCNPTFGATSCIAPQDGVFTVFAFPPSGGGASWAQSVRSGINTLQLIIVQGQNIQILSIQAVVEF